MDMFIPVAESWREATLVICVALVGLMVLDIVTGVAVAWSEHRVSSVISRRGMIRKVLMLLLVGGTGLAKLVLIQLQPDLVAVPFIAFAAGAFAVSEFLSVLENARILGIENPFSNRLADDLNGAVGDGGDVQISQKQQDAANKPLL